ncbi:MAG: hypothetical protein ACI9WC_002369 [Arenicella sp.]|jgi:hypothetical protein
MEKRLSEVDPHFYSSVVEALFPIVSDDLHHIQSTVRVFVNQSFLVNLTERGVSDRFSELHTPKLSQFTIDRIC